MKKRSFILFLSMVLAAAMISGCSNSSESSTSSAVSNASSVASDTSSTSSAAESTVTETSSDINTSDMFSDSDIKSVSSETPNAEIVLSGSSATISDSTRGSFSDGVLTITSKGIYHISGSSEEVSIVVSDSTESGNVYLLLDNVSMTNTSAPCISVTAADKVILQNTGESSLTYTNQDTSAKEDGAVYSKDDMTINGTGTLKINSSLHGVVCKDDLKLANVSLEVAAQNIGIQADTSLRLYASSANVSAGHDAIQLSDSDNDSFLYSENSDITIQSGYDGISVKAEDDSSAFSGYVYLKGGSVNITTASGEGSAASKDSSTSQKGIKTDGNITVTDTDVTISAADDAVHSNAGITIRSGSVEVSSSDDGITASGDLVIDGGTVTVTKSYEGLEAANVTINGGTVSITSSDDGINCAGGSDTTSEDDRPWSTGSDAKLTINGGSVYVNASGDGLDSNGSIYITGGTTIVEGPSASGNGALDKGDGNGCVASITGGTVLAIGTSDMAVNFDSGTQCSALVSLSGSEGTVISADDGSDFSFTATKSFTSVVYSSSSMSQGSTYTIKADSESAGIDFSSSLYYSNVSSMGGGMGGRGGFAGGDMR